MPKERIGVRRNDDGTEAVGEFHVEIGWSQHRDVQMGVCLGGGTGILHQLFGNHAEAVGTVVRKVMLIRAQPGTRICDDVTIGRAVLDGLEPLPAAPGRTVVPKDITIVGEDGNEGEGHYVYSSLWADLGRDDCNQIIRILRRARDAAYGKDE